MLPFQPKPLQRTRLRRQIGKIYYRMIRRWRWLTANAPFARRIQPDPLPVRIVQHHTPLLRQLKAVDMQLQYNKVTNLRLAARRIHGLVIQPGETFSFWYLVGRPSARKGYLPGLVLESGQIKQGIGGGLCQMGNLLYWMALHSPLTVTERWRHSYDVFPDAGRTLPFGSGATLAYNYIDLQLRNDTEQAFQLLVWLDETDLHGAIQSDHEWPERYEVWEDFHVIQQEAWGAYSRHNRIKRRALSLAGEVLREEVAAENHALMMYRPFLDAENS